MIFTIGVVQLPAHWYIDEATLRILGIVLLLIIAFICGPAASHAKRRHDLRVGRNWYCSSEAFPAMLVEMAVSSANWMAMGAIIWLLIGEDVNYFVLELLLVSSIAGVIDGISRRDWGAGAVFIALPGRSSMYSGSDYCRPAVPTACSIIPAAGAGHGLLSGAGESGEETTGEE